MSPQGKWVQKWVYAKGFPSLFPLGKPSIFGLYKPDFWWRRRDSNLRHRAYEFSGVGFAVVLGYP
jgi:hypothetical protein